MCEDNMFFSRVKILCFRAKAHLVFISLIRMRSKRDIKMGRLCTPGGAVLGIVGGGVTFRFLNGILGTFIRSCGCLENPTRF